MNLTQKQKAFCDYYLINPNATEAAKKAGYSKKTAYSVGCENLKKPEIKNYIEKRANKVTNTRIATANEVLEYLSDVMRSEEEATKERIKAADLLGKRYALFVERKQVEERDKQTVVFEFKEADHDE